MRDDEPVPVTGAAPAGRRRALVPLVLATALLTSSCGLSLHELPLGGEGDGPRVTAVFSDVSNLPVGGVVRIGQATVGRVHDLSTKDFKAFVRLDLAPGLRLPEDTAARLELTAALGEQFVVLEPPVAPASPDLLADGDTIPLARTARGPDLENTLAALGTVLGGSGLDQARTVVTELNTALGGREQKVRDLLHRLDALLSEVDSNRAEFDAAIDSLHRLSAATAADTPLLERSLREITPAIDVLLSQREQFERLLTGVTALGRSADGVVREAGPAFTAQLDELRPVLDSLAGFNGDLASTLTELRTFQVKLGGAIPGDYLNLDGTLDVSGTLLPLLTGQNPPLPTGAPEQPVTPPGSAAELLTGGTR
ncbi:MCE family protein [Saccharopolyspora gloriosae]|uniref:Phospholipid/cholesterol/gamma-HCH transport system substrate-binding protein n=1 Tax=Saccharopolyspora gloriosae TaxID=455344 RepID=A0A840NJ23_9PSEU|nr:MCE family protein [Saccharopolyspora gloriosae]MBB5069289.1 phospholipid/cholesterol/gamma-HCH transport system substrate-binding protein [Saccharopolyspora gloriosae]